MLTPASWGVEIGQHPLLLAAEITYLKFKAQTVDFDRAEAEFLEFAELTLGCAMASWVASAR